MATDDIAYLIASHIIVADGEINAKEIAYLNRNFSPSQDAVSEHKRILSADDGMLPLKRLVADFSACGGDSHTLIEQLVGLGYADDYYDKEERILIHHIAEQLNFDTALLHEIETRQNRSFQKQPVTQTLEQYTWADHLQMAFKALLFEMSEDKSEEDETELLSGAKFAKKIEMLAQRAHEDLDYAQHFMGMFNAVLETQFGEIGHHIELLKSSKRIADESANDLYDNLDQLNVEVRQRISDALSDNEKVLNKKRRTVNYFTIAFMGRTKAGKSTFHKVVTHQEDDDIGVGMLRTTRYNRSWYWNSIRIIDTPGIGAPGGKTDTETAKSIIDEADIVCYIVTNDSIQETEFDFIEQLKERNKPLFIILNIKENITHPIRYKKFLKEPLSWRTSVNGGVDGHMARIKGMIGNNYDIEFLEIIPLQLLAAQMFYEDAERETHERDALLLGSNIKEYIRKIKDSVYRVGGLRKSQNILDGSCYSVHYIQSQLDKIRTTLEQGVSKNEKTKEELLSFITRERDKTEAILKKLIEAAYKSIANNARQFAEDHYDDKQASEKWANYSSNKPVMEKLNMNLQKSLEEFSSRLEERIKECIENTSFYFKLAANNSHIEGKKIRNYKLGAGIATSIISAGVLFAWNPGGWLMIGVGTALAFGSWLVTSLFSSKDKKIQKQKDKMYEALCQNIESNKNSCIDSVLNDFYEKSDGILSNIENSMSILINETKYIVKTLSKIIQTAQNTERYLSLCVGYRALQQIGYCRQTQDEKLSPEEIGKLLQVSRDWVESSMTIKTSEHFDSEDAVYLSNLMQMKITLNN